MSMRHGTRTLERPQGTKRRMATRRRCELWPLMSNGKGDASWATVGRSNHHNTPVCQANQRPDLELEGLRQVDEGHVSPTAGRRMRELSIPNSLLLLLHTWQQKWSPSSAVIQLGKMEPAQQSSQQQHRGSASVHSREGAAPPEHPETSDQMMHAHTLLHMHTHNPCMHTYHSLCTHTTTVCTHTTPVCTHTTPVAHTQPPYAHTHKPAYAFTCVHQYTHIIIPSHMHTPHP